MLSYIRLIRSVSSKKRITPLDILSWEEVESSEFKPSRVVKVGGVFREERM